jgi:thiamine-phosphate pyrophosphorylase
VAGVPTHAELISRLLRGGATWIQIREKKLSDDALLAQLKPALERLESGISLIINDRVGLAATAGIAGVHLGQDDAPVAQARAALPKAIIGISTHSLEQALRAAQLPVDYVSIGPVFPTTTKTGNPPLGLEVVRRVRSVVAKPLVAIGGISPANAAQLWKLGVETVAVVSDIMRSADMEGRVRRYLQLWSDLHA